MRQVYGKIILPLKSGTRLLLLIVSLLYGAVLIGGFTKAFSVVEWLGLNSPLVWHGEIWRIISYAFVAPNLLNFVLDVILLGMLGAWLERVWSPREFWIYCMISALGAGIAKVLITPSSPVLIVTNVPLVFGLLVAWARIYGTERVYFMGIWEMSVRGVALIFAGITLLAILPCTGILNTLILLCGGGAGWLYLSLRWRAVRQQQSQTVESVRMGRLEL